MLHRRVIPRDESRQWGRVGNQRDRRARCHSTRPTHLYLFKGANPMLDQLLTGEDLLNAHKPDVMRQPPSFVCARLHTTTAVTRWRTEGAMLKRRAKRVALDHRLASETLVAHARIRALVRLPDPLRSTAAPKERRRGGGLPSRRLARAGTAQPWETRPGQPPSSGAISSGASACRHWEYHKTTGG